MGNAISRRSWSMHPDCLSAYRGMPAAQTSCTTCTGQKPFFTIMDPKTNTGTCSAKECPSCKPKSCCGKHHKHFVINTESNQGVCVRHSDDCTPLCMPQDADPTKKKVCSKGCNQLLKYESDKTAKTEASKFGMLVCQADKQVSCKPANTTSGNSKTKCKVDKTVTAVAICTKFDIDVWNLGPTCIANVVHGAPEVPNCPATASEELVASLGDKAAASNCNSNIKGACKFASLCVAIKTDADRKKHNAKCGPIALPY